MDIINVKFSYLFTLLLVFGVFYTSVPKILYNNKKNFLKKHIFSQEATKFKYNPQYCLYF